MTTRAQRFRVLALVFAGVLLTGCAGTTISGAPSVPNGLSGSSAQTSALLPNTVVIHEYSMNAFKNTSGALLGGIAINSTGNVWVSTNFDVIHVSPTGVSNQLHLYTRPMMYLGGGIVWRNDNTIWYQEYLGQEAYLGETNPAGANLKNIDLLVRYGEQSLTFVTGSDYRIWFTQCASEACASDTGGGDVRAYGTGPVAADYTLGSRIGNSITSGPDNRLYVTERNYSTTASAVARISTTGVVLNQFPLPANSISNLQTLKFSGIVAGPDTNLWIAETGTNKIARMTTTGNVTQFSIPTPNSQPESIVRGNDGNLWFTEFHGNKIGRITPSGQITEYPVPTANAGLEGIANCRLFGCALGPHGHIWFVEAIANKVGRLDF